MTMGKVATRRWVAVNVSGRIYLCSLEKKALKFDLGVWQRGWGIADGLKVLGEVGLKGSEQG